jgi:hypothetical protein
VFQAPPWSRHLVGRAGRISLRDAQRFPFVRIADREVATGHPPAGEKALFTVPFYELQRVKFGAVTE